MDGLGTRNEASLLPEGFSIYCRSIEVLVVLSCVRTGVLREAYVFVLGQQWRHDFSFRWVGAAWRARNGVGVVLCLPGTT